MSNRFVTVNITRQTKPVSEKGFGLPLVFATSKPFEYKVYRDISDAVDDFATDTKEYKMLSRMFGQNPKPAEIAIFGVQYDSETGSPTDLVTALNTLIKTHNDFYYLTSVEQGDEEIEALAEWISTQDKIYVASSASEMLYAKLKGKYDNVHLLIHNEPESYPAEGLVASLAPLTIGSYTWTFKNIAGVAPVDFDNSKINKIHENNCNTYITEGGVNITSHGVATSGEYMDVIQGEHFITAKITENIFGMLVRTPKVPFTSAGIALAVAEIEKALDLAGKNGIIAIENDDYQYTITIPKIEDIPTNSKAKRQLPDIPWKATIAGAIEEVTINGVLAI
ncbi:DUF3383 family protein [Bacillus sp. JJ722]|uniref:DUF3383 family protein n=1 Tax=Bacillus sp. JJ722 TaxID=3122973 RepID=UPI002FFEC06D